MTPGQPFTATAQGPCLSHRPLPTQPLARASTLLAMALFLFVLPLAYGGGELVDYRRFPRKRTGRGGSGNVGRQCSAGLPRHRSPRPSAFFNSCAGLCLNPPRALGIYFEVRLGPCTLPRFGPWRDFPRSACGTLKLASCHERRRLLASRTLRSRACRIRWSPSWSPMVRHGPL